MHSLSNTRMTPQRGSMMGPHFEPKRSFHGLGGYSVPHLVHKEKSFVNPNFVNKQNPSIHNYHSITQSTLLHPQNYSYLFTVNSCTDNSSHKILDQVKDFIPQVEETKEIQSSTEIPTTDRMIYTKHKNNKRNHSHGKTKAPGKNSKQNLNRNIISDMMDIDSLENDVSNSFDTQPSPKSYSDCIPLVDFIKFSPTNKVPSIQMTEIEILAEPDEVDFIHSVTISITPPNRSKINIRERQVSIAESEDSFIVFDTGTEDNCDFSEEENNVSSEDEDDIDASSQSEDDGVDEDFDSTSSVIPHKRVRFANDGDLCEIHPMIKWSFAYQAARKGPWEEYARDRERFKMRVSRTENELAPIFDPKHRDRIYMERFAHNSMSV